MRNILSRVGTLLLILTVFLFPSVSSFALDTDIYQASVKQNAYILLDSSGSMAYGVFESNVDYGGMFNYLFDKDDVTDTIMLDAYGPDWEDYFYTRHYDLRKIFLVKGNIGAQIINVDGSDRVFTGDAADPDYLWYTNDMVDTHTYIDTDGNLIGEPGETPRITVDSDGYVLLDGSRLPLGQDILLKDFKTLYDGSMINDGFGGLLNAPGYYCSGYEGVTAGGHDLIDDGDVNIYFFITGNWMNMQQMYNLHYTYDHSKPAWKYERYPQVTTTWATTTYALDFPEGAGNYLDNQDTSWTITHGGAGAMQVHFSFFDIEADGSASSWTYDYLKLKDSNGNVVATYDNGNSPEGDWSPVISGDKIKIEFHSDGGVVKQGFTIDQYRTTDTAGYLMQDRVDVAKDSIKYVVNEFDNKINWGLATFDNGDGADILYTLNSQNTDKEDYFSELSGVTASGGTPLGEALQDIFEEGFFDQSNALGDLMCRKNYTIVLSDGFPSADTDWSRISGVTFQDWDSDGFTADPYQYDNPPDNYYDDVSKWVYTHSWRDKTSISLSDAASSYENIIPHQISFGARHPLMRNAAYDAGGETEGAQYYTAYNKAQLVNAFYSFGMMISESMAFTAPVVSVDEANKIQNGDDLYMGQFLPVDNSYWPGNVKHFKLGDGTANRPDLWQIYDAANNEATDSDGHFVDNLVGFWGDSSDANDTDSYGGQDIQEDGVGEVLTERIANDYSSHQYYERNIKTWIGNSLVEFNQTTVTPVSLGLASDKTVVRNKVVNWIYGYTFDEESGTGHPVATRDWALGAIVHSRPTVVDYYDASNYSTLIKRYIAVGADDGMLHVFDNTTGAEVFAFVPDDVMSKLPAFGSNVFHQPLVDGQIKLFRENGQPKYLIFGLRRGGSSYWIVNISDSNPTNWTVAKFSDTEMGQSWSNVEFAKVRTGAATYANVAIFSGGYDPVEDNYPEPFDDIDNDGTPYAADASIDNNEWDSTDGDQDINNNDSYDLYNSAGDSHGRAVYIVNLDTGAILFSVKHGSTNVPSTLGSFAASTSQTRTDFKYSFPATPSVVTLSEYYHENDNTTAREDNVLAAIYAPDIYGNLFRISYDYGDDDNNGSGDPKWQVKHIFSANPDSTNGSGVIDIWGHSDNTNAGRKVFYGPAVSWRGSGRYFDPSNYSFPGVKFEKYNFIASLFFGTGDREHPTYQVIQNRIYAVYDDTPVTAADAVSSVSVDVNSVPYGETDLLNVTCDELGINTTLTDGAPGTKLDLEKMLLDDVVNPSDVSHMELDSGGAGENDAKGWYIILEKQGLPSYCSHCNYPATVDSSVGGRDYHFGEKILSKLTLFAGNLYFTSYQPAYDDPCAPQGNAFNYALNYLNGAAALNLNAANDVAGGGGVGITVQKDVTDRYGKHEGVKGIPSGFEVVIRNGKAAAMASVGGSIIGGGEGGGFEIPYEDFGIDLYYWIEQ